MSQLLTAPPGTPIAELAARHILDVLPATARAEAVVFVPTRRAVVTLREAFQRALAGAPSLLPRILPLADSEQAILTVLGGEALELLAPIPPAMPEWQQRYFITAQVKAFLERRGGVVTLDYALALAEELMALQEQCARASVTLTPEALQGLVGADTAEHWQEALAFLGILAEHWPVLEAELGMTIASLREARLVEALAAHWRQHPPQMRVFAVGSTASQEQTAALLQVIAESAQGTVILPGLDPSVDAAEWGSVAAGHPLFHIRQFLDRMGVAPHQVQPLAGAQRSIWLEALAGSAQIPHWGARPLPDYGHVKLVPCAHAESEARAISLLMREALDTPGKRTALVTPDEGLMARVAAQMKRYGVVVDRMTRGTLATTESGSLWLLLITAMREPERLLHLRSLLHHPLVAAERHFLDLLEPCWYGVAPRRNGQLPRVTEAVRMHGQFPALERLVRELARHGRLQMTVGAWVDACAALLSPWLDEAGEGAEMLDEALAALRDAELLGTMDVVEFAGLVEERFAAPVRHGGVATHPQLSMLTPVEARLQQFDRVILGGMTEALWPGLSQGNAWLNLSAQQALGLPSPLHHVSLMAHDVLMFGSCDEVFLSWPQRDKGAPAARSRFIERLVTLLAMHGVEEHAVAAPEYPHWAAQAHAAEAFTPHPPVEPRPPVDERPAQLPVSALDTLFADPFAVYARYVLRLKEVEAIDAEPEASDFGSLAHKAIQALTLHWNSEMRPATAAELETIAAQALRAFTDRPSVALFWRARLLRALDFVNDEENGRRAGLQTVVPEVTVENQLSLAEGRALTLHGRIDRLEHGAQGVTLADYKTGEIPSAKQVLDGHATQLLAYMMLLDQPVEAIEYWRLPHGRYKGEIVSVAVEDLLAQQLPGKLTEALSAMRDARTPFLACPGRFGEIYNGISRYEEWAG